MDFQRAIHHTHIHEDSTNITRHMHCRMHTRTHARSHTERECVFATTATLPCAQSPRWSVLTSKKGTRPTCSGSGTAHCNTEESDFDDETDPLQWPLALSNSNDSRLHRAVQVGGRSGVCLSPGGGIAFPHRTQSHRA